jgi:hypothetical protein
MAPKRCPTELDFRIGHSVLLQRELLKENVATVAPTKGAGNISAKRALVE